MRSAGGGVCLDTPSVAAGPLVRLRYRRRVRVWANGEPVELADHASVADLLATLGMGSRWVLVERNGEPVPRRELASTVLADGDRLELVRAVAGG